MPAFDKAGLESAELIRAAMKEIVQPELEKFRLEMAEVRKEAARGIDLFEKLISKKAVLTFEDKE